MLTGNREYNEIYKKYKNLVLKVAYIYSGDTAGKSGRNNGN